MIYSEISYISIVDEVRISKMLIFKTFNTRLKY